MHVRGGALSALVSVAVASASPALAQHLRPDTLAAMPVSQPLKVEAYGADPLQFGELRLPAGKGPFPVAVLVHGGCWTKGFATLSYMSPLAADLAKQGVATWNIEYRELGDAGGGWPGSFLDWAAGTDHLRSLAKVYPLDLSRVVVVGHSAGAHAALWIASRDRIAASSPIRGGGRPLAVKAAVAIDGPGAITGGFLAREVAICGKPVIEDFMGGAPQTAPERYAQGDPAALLPVRASETLVASAVLTPDEARDYQKAAAAKGQSVNVITLNDAGHFDMLSPATPSGADVEQAILRAVGVGPSPR